MTKYGLTVAEANDRIAFAVNQGLIWLDQLAKRADFNKRLWRRLRGIAYEGWGA